MVLIDVKKKYKIGTKFINFFLDEFWHFLPIWQTKLDKSAKNAEIWLKIEGFCAIFVENFQINKYHIITFYDKIVG